ncbi:MAG: amidase [Desulfobacteraceae bacterium]|nr:amidase [Desulfobacteraceae bacterium]
MEKKKIASAYCNDVLGTLDGVELAELIAAGEIKAVEVVEAAIARARKVNPSINAIATETFEQALVQAGQIIINAPFGGVPSFIKDTDDVAGVPTRFGSRAVSERPAATSSKVVSQFNAMGFVTLGKSALPELGLTATTEPLVNGPTRNPWNLDHSTGGSSGGSAALVAAGVVPIAHGNDGGGSIRIPAACCGLVGLKPSLGRLPNRDGADKMPINLVSHGILSRTVRDTAAFYAGAEKCYANPELPGIGLVTHPGKQRLRIALVTDAPCFSPENSSAVDQVIKAGKVCEELGHKVEEVPFPFHKQVMDDFFFYWAALAFSFHHFGHKVTGSPIDKNKLEKFTFGLSRHYRNNILKTPFVIRRLRKFARAYESFFEEYDILLSLTASDASPELGYLGTELDFDIAFERLKKFIPFTAYQNLAGAPAISLPLGQSRDGLPVGVQFAAALGQEKRLLELAFELEQAMPWPRNE